MCQAAQSVTLQTLADLQRAIRVKFRGLRSRSEWPRPLRSRRGAMEEMGWGGRPKADVAECA